MFDPKDRHNKREGWTLVTVGQLTTGSNQRVAWKCDKHPKHKWVTDVRSWSQGRTLCPTCSIRRRHRKPMICEADVETQRRWRALFDPKAWHNKREGWTLETVGQLTTGSHQKVAWKCDKHPKHKWVTQVRKWSQGRTLCPTCQ